MPYKCLKCGCENTSPLPVKKFESEATIPENCEDTGDVAFGTKVEEAGIIINCKNCNNFGSSLDKTKFAVIE